MFGSTRGFSGMADSMEPCSLKCGADPCCHGNDIWPRRRDLVAYRGLLFHVFTGQINDDDDDDIGLADSESQTVTFSDADATKLSSCVASASAVCT